MFQLDLLLAARYHVDDFAKNRQSLRQFSVFSGTPRLESRQTQVRVFVLVRDFGKYRGLLKREVGNDLAATSCRLLVQNLSKIPPRSERPFGPTSRSLSPLLIRD